MSITNFTHQTGEYSQHGADQYVAHGAALDLLHSFHPRPNAAHDVPHTFESKLEIQRMAARLAKKRK